jgi:uncharacterized protein (DUF1501 family)
MPASPELNRRGVLKVAGASALGLWAATATVPAASEENSAAARGQAAARPRSVIFIWLNGGPSQFETFDPKPNASEDIRGPFGCIRTHVPGVLVSELIPQLARHFDKYAIVRSLAHRNANHSSTAMMTGIEGGDTPFGAVVTKLLGSSEAMPGYVHIGSSKGDGTQFVSAVDNLDAGSLGNAFAPLRVRSPLAGGVQLGDFSLRDSVPPGRFHKRQELLAQLQHQQALRESAAGRQMDQQQSRAAEILSSSRVRDAFDLSREPEVLRYRYGANHFGQSCLLARRLVEAGTRYVQIKWYHVAAFDAWDTHGADLPGMRRLEQQLCPRFDMGLASLLQDLHDRGLLETTLVVAVGEFGRTPTLNKNGDRDHWPFCFSALMAGGGIHGGTVVGESDRKGAYPVSDAYSPADFAATIYQLAGIPVATDLRIRPFVQDGLPIKALWES